MDRKKSLAVCLIVFGCGCSREPQITVGSKNFTEQVVLGEIIAQHLEKRLGKPVARKLNLGGTLLAHQALVHQQIDLYPEYSGTALMEVLKLVPDADSARVDRRVRDEYRRRWNVEWLPALGFNNSFALVVRPGEGVESLSQAALRKTPWTMAAGYEFEGRPDGLSRLQKIYSLPLVGPPKYMDLGLVYQALEQKQVDLAVGSETDALIQARGLKVLADDKQSFPPYHASIAVRRDSLDRWPGLRVALAELSGKLTTEMMRNLNLQVIDGRKREADVAAEWLKTGLAPDRRSDRRDAPILPTSAADRAVSSTRGLPLTPDAR
jgi:glycine betaine/choline ABC-type transport system substrate-binding protein